MTKTEMHEMLAQADRNTQVEKEPPPKGTKGRERRSRARLIAKEAGQATIKAERPSVAL